MPNIIPRNLNASEGNQSSSIVWMFPNADYVHFSAAATPFFGTIIIPNGSVKLDTGNYNGCMIVGGDGKLGTEGHLWKYNGTILKPVIPDVPKPTEPIAPTPEPTVPDKPVTPTPTVPTGSKDSVITQTPTSAPEPSNITPTPSSTITSSSTITASSVVSKSIELKGNNESTVAKTSGFPATGDTSHAIVWYITLAAAAVVLVIIVHKYKKF